MAWAAVVTLPAFGGKCLSEDLPLLLDIVTDVLTNPIFPEEHVDKVRGQVLTGLQERDNDTQHGLADLPPTAVRRGSPLWPQPGGERETVTGITHWTWWISTAAPTVRSEGVRWSS
ncbi:hypothetical protein [Candidatus Amarobacter glycogenicus]|uniref:hypothetical protein n=1 Tax=Candidatus Amarobacter glycogenicus TaxID=3140699 RepID=UPI002A103FEE|nr:insulinase family protein [Dehalococcoidia bacterium]